MPRPLIQKLCSFCGVSFTAAARGRNILCPACSRNRTILHRFVKERRKFKVHLTRDGGKHFSAVYMNVYSNKNIEHQSIIGYVSPFTKQLFLGVVESMNIKDRVFQVTPIRRREDSNYAGMHSVKFDSVICKFTHE